MTDWNTRGLSKPRSRKFMLLIALGVALVLALAAWGSTKIPDRNAAKGPTAENTAEIAQTQYDDVKQKLTDAESRLAALVSEYSRVKTEGSDKKAELETRLSSASADYASLQAQYASQELRKAAVQAQLSSAQTDYSNLLAEYSRLEKAKAGIELQLSVAQSEIDKLKADGQSMQKTLVTAQASLTRVEQDLAQAKQAQSDLTDKYNSLARSKIFVADNNLRVTFSTEEQFLSTKWIAGQVTNAGSKLVSKAYVIVARYNADGSLEKVDFPPFLVAGLRPGDTASFSFLTSGEAFKIMVLSDY